MWGKGKQPPLFCSPDDSMPQMSCLKPLRAMWGMSVASCPSDSPWFLLGPQHNLTIRTLAFIHAARGLTWRFRLLSASPSLSGPSEFLHSILCALCALATVRNRSAAWGRQSVRPLTMGLCALRMACGSAFHMKKQGHREVN